MAIVSACKAGLQVGRVIALINNEESEQQNIEKEVGDKGRVEVNGSDGVLRRQDGVISCDDT
jgi:hypothetical protein